MTSEPGPSLSSAEMAVLAWADREERQRLTTAEIARVVGTPRAREVASSLAAKGLLARIGQGVYRPLPLGAAGTRRTGSAVAAAALLFADRPYYVGGRTAASLHRLTTQRYDAVVDVYTAARLRSRPIGTARLVVHTVAPALMEFGIEPIEVDQVRVVVSDPERTILDLLDRPERLLGFAEARRLLQKNLPHLRVQRLVTYARRWPNQSTARRLGVLLEHGGVDATTLAPLVRHLARSRGDAVLVPGGPRRGPMHPRFRVILNGPTDR